MRSFTFDAFAGVIASPGWTAARATAAIAMNVNAASAARTIRVAAVHSRALRTSLMKCSMSYLLLGREIAESKQLGCHCDATKCLVRLLRKNRTRCEKLFAGSDSGADDGA